MITIQGKRSKCRWILGLFVIFVAMGLISGGAFSVGAAKKITLNMWVQMPVMIEMRDYRLPEFLKRHPELEIKYTTPPTGEALIEKFLIAVIGGQELPDIIEAMGFSSQTMIKLASYVNLSEQMAPYIDGFSRVMMRQFSDLDGKPRQVPMSGGAALGRFYRKDVYDEFGLTPAEDYDGLIENGKKLKAQGWTNFPLVAERDDWWTPWWFIMFASQAGSGMFDFDGNLVLDSAKAIEGMKMMKKIYDSGITMDVGSYWGPSWWETVKSEDGPVASFPSNYNWLNLTGKDRTMTPQHGSWGKWRVTNLPAFYPGVTQSRYASQIMGGSFALGILTASKNRDLAWELIEHASTSKEVAVALIEYHDILAYVPALTSPKVMDAQWGALGDQKSMAVWADILENQFSDSFLPAAWREVQVPLGIEVSKILRGEIGVEEALKQFAQMVREDILPKYAEYAE